MRIGHPPGVLLAVPARKPARFDHFVKLLVHALASYRPQDPLVLLSTLQDELLELEGLVTEADMHGAEDMRERIPRIREHALSIAALCFRMGMVFRCFELERKR